MSNNTVNQKQRNTNVKTHNNTTQKNNSNQNRNNVSGKKNVIQEEPAKNYFLIPIFIILCIIPLIVKYKDYNPNMAQFPWFSSSTSQVDLFLFYKNRWFLMITGVIAVATAIKLLYKRKAIPFSKIFIPLALYAILSLLSAVFSKYASFSLTGSFEMFESVFSLLGYCLIVYYVFVFINSERDLIKIQYFLVGFALLMSLLGIFQYIGYDFFNSEIGRSIIIPAEIRQYIKLDMVFGAHSVYLTLFNPNYVGVYVALVVPILVMLLFFQKKVVPIILISCAVIGLIICVIGSHSFAGVIGLGVAAVAIMIFMWRHLFKHFKITIAAVLILLIGLIFIGTYHNHYFVNKVESALQIQKTEYKLTDIHTEGDGISIKYNNNTMKLKYLPNDVQTTFVYAYDQNGNLISSVYDAVTSTYSITDSRFEGITYGCDQGIMDGFYIQADGLKYRFCYFEEAYYYLNAYNKPVEMISAPSALFHGYEKFATGRGYIWSRTIPLLKDHILLGSGPDTFTLVFPQQDYMNKVRYGYGDEIVTKPHCMYLQMAVQTGALSLIAFLVFYGMYFASSVSLYLRGRYTSYYAKFGVAVFIGTFCYMVTGLTNDSNINTAPIFWTMMGVGILVNSKAKPLILKEIAEIKKEREKIKGVNETSNTIK